MSLAEIILSNFPLFVNTTIRRRSASVFPNAAHLFSDSEWLRSSRTRIGLLKNICSHSQFSTLCLMRFLSILPRSHWKPKKLSKSFSIMNYCIWQKYTYQEFSKVGRNNFRYAQRGNSENWFSFIEYWIFRIGKACLYSISRNWKTKERAPSILLPGPESKHRML